VLSRANFVIDLNTRSPGQNMFCGESRLGAVFSSAASALRRE
jgi:hypothetical protein